MAKVMKIFMKKNFIAIPIQKEVLKVRLRNGCTENQNGRKKALTQFEVRNLEAKRAKNAEGPPVTDSIESGNVAQGETEDISFTEALDQRDAKRKSDTEQQAEHQPKRHRGGNFDDSEGEEVYEQDEPEEGGWAEPEGDEATEETEPPCRRRRLYAKSNPEGTGYSVRPLVSRAAYKIQKHKLKVILQ